MGVAAMEYRNIDQDINLYNGAKRYWNDDQISKEQLHWILGEKEYSEKEIDHAIADYYYVYVWPNILINRLVLFLLVVILCLLCLLNFL